MNNLQRFCHTVPNSFIWVFVLSCSLYSQTVFGGRIINARGEGVVDMDIELVLNGVSTLTNSTGDFRFTLDPSSPVLNRPARPSSEPAVRFNDEGIFIQKGTNTYDLRGKQINNSLLYGRVTDQGLYEVPVAKTRAPAAPINSREKSITIRWDTLKVSTYGYQTSLYVDTWSGILPDMFVIDPEGANAFEFEGEFAWELLELYAFYRENVPAEPPFPPNPKQMYVDMDEPYTVYYETEEADELRNILLNRRAALGVQRDSTERGYRLSYVYSGSPAEKAGMRAGDVITAIAGTSVVGMSYENLSNLIKGDEGESRPMTLERGNQVINVTVVFETVEFPSVYYYYTPVDSLPYIYISGFKTKTLNNLSTTDLLVQGLEYFKDEDHIILDFRGNGGGALSTAIEMIGEFVPDNTPALSFFTFEYQGAGQGSVNEEVMYTDTQGQYADKNYYVLMDGGSASASELFISALMDNRPEFYFIGTRTYGKARAQYIILTPMAGLARLTVGTLTPIISEDYDMIGIDPEIFADEERDAYQIAADLILLSDPAESSETLAGKSSKSRPRIPLGSRTGVDVSVPIPLLVMHPPAMPRK